MGDHESRYAAGLDVLRTLAGSEDLQRGMADRFEHPALYRGFPRAIVGMLLARKLFAEQDAAG